MANRTVGEKIFLAKMGSWDMHYTEATITKVLPSGMIDVQIGACEPMRFNADGSLREREAYPGERYHQYKLDSISHEERLIFIEIEKRTKQAAAAIMNVRPEDRVNFRWGKDGLAKEVERLQALLDEAKQKVEAI